MGGKTLQVLLQRGSIMLALLLSVLVTVGWGQQNFAPVQYNLITTPGECDPGTQPIQSQFISSASNGYGTWAVDGQGRWYLLSNSLADPSFSTSAPIAGGVVESGQLEIEDAAISEMKVVANLAGNVRFVCPSFDRTGFIVQGFNDDRSTYLDRRQINIHFDGIPHDNIPIDSRLVIKQAIKRFAKVPIEDGGSTDKIFSVTGEPDYRDIFDIAIDSEFLYIIWRASVASDTTLLQPCDIFPPPCDILPPYSNTKINVTVLRLSTNSVFNPSFPKQVCNSCIRPTIAGNVRNSWKPAFFASMIVQNIGGPVALNSVTQLGYDGTINSIIGTGVVPTSFFDPAHTNVSTQPPPIPFKNPQRTRIVVSSSQGTTSTLLSKVATYIIGNNADSPTGDILAPTGHDLVLFYKGESSLRYVDGAHISVHEMPVGSPTPFFIVNSPLIAFANPYDGEETNANEEIHCLYQLDDTRGGTPFNMKNPLFIVRGSNNGTIQNKFNVAPQTFAYTPQTRTVLTKYNGASGLPSPKKINDKFTYISSVNQMGIHTYWTGDANATTSRLYYMRDFRHLDEDIEENTLLTYENIVSDGTTHGGTIGAKLLAERIMTLWTDPNFGNGLLYNSLTTQIGWQNARLTFVGQGVRLDIGEQAIPVCTAGGEQAIYIPCSTTWAKLVMLPNTEIRFEDVCERSDKNHVLSINPGSTFEFYGNPSNSGLSNILGAGTINFAGQGNVGLLPPGQSWSPGISRPATLNIHGGATFVVPNSCFFIADKTNIDCKFEPNVTTLGSATNATGLFRHHGTAELSNSYVNGHNTSSTPVPILNIRPPLPFGTPFIAGNCSLASQQWLSENVEYSNTPNTGSAKLLADGTTSTTGVEYRDITFDGGTMKAVEVDIQNPVQNVTINDHVFTKTQNTAINIERSLTRDYSVIDVTNNTFTFDVQNVSGINVNRFDHRRLNTEDKILVDNNTITSTASAPTFTNTPFGIQIKNTDAKVTNNEITGAGFFNGIFIDGANITDGSTTFICSNSIEEITGNGIYTRDWKGYAFLNSAVESGIGHLHGGDFNANIFFSSYENNIGAGLKVTNARSMFLHKLNDGTYNIAGNNTIAHNNQAGGTGQMELEDFSQIFLGTNSTGNNGGDNNVIANNITSDKFGYTSQTSGTGGWIRFEKDPNYWAFGIGNGTLYTIIPSTDGMFVQGINHFIDPAIVQHSSRVTAPSFDCGSGYIPQVIESSNSDSSWSSEDCDKLGLKINGYSGSSQDQLVYDSTMFYIEHCYNVLGSWNYFSTMGSSVSYLVKKGKVIPKDYREWLKSVLYLNRDSLYYCNDVLEIARSYLFLDSGSGTGILGDEAATVCKFILDSGQCSFMKENFISMEKDKARYQQYLHWKDTVTDSIATPYSPGYTTLEALDLTILRGFKNGVSADITKPLQRNPISEARAIPNPLKDEVELWYKLTEGALVKIEVYDALGKQMYSVAQGYKPEGENRLHLDTQNWSTGSYYARFTTLGGEVKTIKLMKE